MACLKRAIDASFITQEELTQEIAAGHVRPSLLKELNQPEVLKSELRKIDAGFVAPYRAIRSGKARPWTSWRSMIGFYARRGLQRRTR